MDSSLYLTLMMSGKPEGRNTLVKSLTSELTVGETLNMSLKWNGERLDCLYQKTDPHGKPGQRVHTSLTL